MPSKSLPVKPPFPLDIIIYADLLASAFLKLFNSFNLLAFGGPPCLDAVSPNLLAASSIYLRILIFD